MACFALWMEIFVQRFEFPTIPLSQARYHIHSPEWFASTHCVTAPGFKLIQTHPPRELKDGYKLIAFDFKTILGRHSARMFTRDRDTSEILILDQDGRIFTMATLKTERDKGMGHILTVKMDFFRNLTFWERFLGPALAKVRDVEQAINVGYRVREEDMNLRRYRSMVME